MLLNIGYNLCAVGSRSLYTTFEDLGSWVINFGKKEIGGENVIEMMLGTRNILFQKVAGKD